MYFFPNLEPVQFCYFLTCMQMSQEAGRWSDIPTSRIIFQFVVIHTVKGFGIVNKAEIDISLGRSCFFDDPSDVGNLNFGMFMIHVLSKPDLENFEDYFASVWNESNCAVIWMFFGHPFWASLIAQLVKNLPARQETLVWFLGWEDPLEKGQATHSTILA